MQAVLLLLVILIHQRIKRLAPIPTTIIHHNLNHNRQYRPQNRTTVRQLCTIDTTVVGCPTMYDLIAYRAYQKPQTALRPRPY